MLDGPHTHDWSIASYHTQYIHICIYLYLDWIRIWHVSSRETHLEAMQNWDQTHFGTVFEVKTRLVSNAEKTVRAMISSAK